MRLRILAVGSRMPAWVDTAVADYLRRIRSPWKLELTAIDAAPRSAARGALQATQREGERVLAALRERERAVLLDETGRQLDTRELAARLSTLEREAPDVALLIGGPDGHSPAVRARAAECWSLSRLTLPHALARVLLAEQIYRAQSILLGHPYHRD
jgi:23S rRNA (pseudouridine1915-N3)-methyltransferase